MSSMEAVRAATSGTVNAELSLYLNRRGRFSAQPDAHLGITIPTEGLRDAGRGARIEFVGDADGDGRRDLLLRDDPSRLRVLALGRGRRGLEFAAAPLFEVRIDERAEVLVGRDDPPEILVLEKGQVLHVRFRE